MTEEQKADLEYQYLLWFWDNADFGPSDGDVRYYMNEEYEKRTGNPVPDGYKSE